MAILVISPPVQHAFALDVDAVRFGAHPDKTRMVIELDRASDFSAFMLPQIDDKPYRLVVDLPDFNWKAGAIPKPPKTDIMDVRSGNLKPGLMRIVVDLEKPASIQSAFLLPQKSGKPDRLVIDFVPLSKAAFAAADRKIFGTLNSQSQNESDNGGIFERLLSSQNDQTAQTSGPSSPSDTAIVIPARKPVTTAEMFNDKPAERATPQTPLRKPLIVIDPGHGGADPGAVGAGNLREKNITLATAKELKAQLERTGRYNVELTRSDDRYLKLHQRVSFARKKSADLFISLHADSIDKPKVSGASIYTLSNKASDQQTAKLAARENQVDLIAGVDLSHEDKDVANILIDLAMRDTMNQSKFFANTVVEKKRARGIQILERPHRYAGFAVLKAPDIPSVLVEMGFMSNKGEAKLLSTRGYQQKIAAALVESIDSYFAKVRKNDEK